MSRSFQHRAEGRAPASGTCCRAGVGVKQVEWALCGLCRPFVHAPHLGASGPCQRLGGHFMAGAKSSPCLLL